MLQRHSLQANAKTELLLLSIPHVRERLGLPETAPCCSYQVLHAISRALSTDAAEELREAFVYLSRDADVVLSAGAHAALLRCRDVVETMLTHRATVRHEASRWNGCCFELRRAVLEGLP